MGSDKRKIIEAAEMAYELVKANGGQDVYNYSAQVYAYIEEREDCHGVDQVFTTAGRIDVENGSQYEIIWEESNAFLGFGPRIMSSDGEAVVWLHEALTRLTVLHRLADV